MKGLNMRKILAICLTACLVCSLTACGETGSAGVSSAAEKAEAAKSEAADSTEEGAESEDSKAYETEDDIEMWTDAGKGEYKKTVTVSNIEDFINAIDNDTKIILENGVYNFAGLDAEKVNNPWIYIETYGGISEYAISGVSNLSIEAEENEVGVVTEDPSSPILRFEYCSNISIDGVTFGHEVDPGSCTGSVLALSRTKNFNVRNCYMYGCGTYGIDADESTGIYVTDSDIYSCSEGAFLLEDSDVIEFDNCELYANEGFNLFRIIDCYGVTIMNTEIRDNKSGYPGNPIIDTDGSMNIKFTDCTFRDNYIEPDPDELPDVVFENCEIGGE
jgi:predicted small lipoprotein YifL